MGRTDRAEGSDQGALRRRKGEGLIKVDPAYILVFKIHTSLPRLYFRPRRSSYPPIDPPASGLLIPYTPLFPFIVEKAS
jgi:hypothetical protein